MKFQVIYSTRTGRIRRIYEPIEEGEVALRTHLARGESERLIRDSGQTIKILQEEIYSFYPGEWMPPNDRYVGLSRASENWWIVTAFFIGDPEGCGDGSAWPKVLEHDLAINGWRVNIDGENLVWQRSLEEINNDLARQQTKLEKLNNRTETRSDGSNYDPPTETLVAIVSQKIDALLAELSKRLVDN